MFEKVLRVQEEILEKGLGERVAHVAKVQIGGFRIDSEDGLESIKITTCYRRKEEVSRDYSLIGEVIVLGESEEDGEAVGMPGIGGTLEKEMEVGQCETNEVVLTFFFGKGESARRGR